jgi:hypothetical protein
MAIVNTNNHMSLCVLLPAAVRRWRLALLLLVAISCSTGTAQPLAQLITAGPSMAQALMDRPDHRKALTTCWLTLEGGSNATEMAVYGTSIARAELTCTPRVTAIAVHPVLARFTHRFSGVEVASIPDIEDLKHAEKEAKDNEEDCFSSSGYIFIFCGETSIEFAQLRILNLNSQGVEQNIGGAAASGSVMTFGSKGVVSFVEPFVSRLQYMVFHAQANLVYVKGGLFNDTMGILGGGVMLYDGTKFTHNEGIVWGGAVTIMAGHAVFRDCVFEANRARTLDDSTRGVTTINVFRSGSGGAVLGHLLTRGNQTSAATRLQTTATFLNCTFVNNTAYEGGAIAMFGVNTTISNCTFTGNRAMQNGFDVFASRGGALDIVGSNITATSPTVAWERVDVRQCLRGEYFGELEGTCRRCSGATYSLATPVPAGCSSCPLNAKVGVPQCGWLSLMHAYAWGTILHM